MDIRRTAPRMPGATLPKRKGPGRLAALGGAAIAAALFTPVPAIADVGVQPTVRLVAAAATDPAAAVAGTPISGTAQHTVTRSSIAMSPELMARSLISTGMVGIGLALGGLVIVAHRRRQW